MDTVGQAFQPVTGNVVDIVGQAFQPVTGNVVDRLESLSYGGSGQRNRRSSDEPAHMDSGDNVKLDTEIMTDHEIYERGMALLAREFGPVACIRFVQRIRPGVGNYTAERHEWQDGLGVADVAARIRGREPEWEGRGLLPGPQDTSADEEPEGPTNP